MSTIHNVDGNGDDLNMDGCGPGKWEGGVGVSKTWPISAEVINGWHNVISLPPNGCHLVKVTIAEILITYFKSCVNTSSPTIGMKTNHTMTSKIGLSTVILPAINVI